MSEMLTRAAAAIEQAFKDRISATAGQPFESIGVTAPGFDVWEAYARAAVLATYLTNSTPVLGAFRKANFAVAVAT